MSEVVNSQTITYTLDLVSGLTQVLADGENAYLYGSGRIAQLTGNGMEYFLTDALGSVRQVVDDSGVLLNHSYEPYGEVMTDNGDGATRYGFTGEQQDVQTGLVYLRARYYSPNEGIFTSRDTWTGDANQPMSYNAWLYVLGNPINLTDPSGKIPCWVCNSIPNLPARLMCERDCKCSEGNPNGPLPPPTPIPGSDVDEAFCNQLSSQARDAYNTYLALRDHAGWWNRNTEGVLTPQKFLGLLARMEFSQINNSPHVDESIHEETLVRNFYYICSDARNHCSDSRSSMDIFNYIEDKKLLEISTRPQLKMKPDSPAEMIAQYWMNNMYYSSANFEHYLLNPGNWSSYSTNKFWDKPVDWGNISMFKYDEHPKYDQAVIVTQGNCTDRNTDEMSFYIVRGSGDTWVVMTLGQASYWHGFGTYDQD